MFPIFRAFQLLDRSKIPASRFYNKTRAAHSLQQWTSKDKEWNTFLTVYPFFGREVRCRPDRKLLDLHKSHTEKHPRFLHHFSFGRWTWIAVRREQVPPSYPYSPSRIISRSGTVPLSPMTNDGAENFNDQCYIISNSICVKSLKDYYYNFWRTIVRSLFRWVLEVVNILLKSTT